MRLLRIAALSALILAVLIGGSAALIAANQARIVAYVLASVRNRTGVDIIPRASSVHLSTHLVVVLDHPQVIANGQEIVKLKSLRAIISYHSHFRQHRTSALSADRDPARHHASGKLRRTRRRSHSRVPGRRRSTRCKDALHALSRICWRVEAVDATVRYADGTAVATHVGIVAYRTRRDPYRWLLGFSGALLERPFPARE